MATVLAATLAGCWFTRFVLPPWHDDHPSRLELGTRLEAEHLARRLDDAVDRLDLAPLRDAYARSGSLPYRPDLLLKVVLYEIRSGHHSPAQWARDARTSDPVRWLLRGYVPSRSCWYAFRDRCGPCCDEFNRFALVSEATARSTPGRFLSHCLHCPYRCVRRTPTFSSTLLQSLRRPTNAVVMDDGGHIGNRCLRSCLPSIGPGPSRSASRRPPNHPMLELTNRLSLGE